MDAAIACLQRYGLEKTGVGDIAATAGVTKPTLYYYFENKSALFLEILQTEADLLTHMIEQTAASRGPLRERLIGGLRSYVEHHQQNPMTLALLLRAEMQGEAGQPEFNRLLQKDLEHPIEPVGEALRARMPWLNEEN